VASGWGPANESDEVDPRLRLMSENLPVVMWTTDGELRFTNAFGAVIPTFGVDPRQVIGVRLDDFLGPGQTHDQAVPAHRRALGGEPVTYQTEFAGSVFHAHVAPMRDAGGAVVGVIGVALDVTTRARAERERDAAREQLARVEKLAALGTLAASIGHEISNPLTYILANVRVAATEVDRLAHPEDAQGPPGKSLEEIRSALEDVQIGAERVHHIVRDLWLFARNEPEERGRTDDGAAVLQSALRLAAVEVRQAADLEVDLAQVCPIAIHETRLAQICLNLLLNAAHAIPPEVRGHIGVSLREAAGMVELVVTDDGSGIPDHVLPHIFDPFFTTKPETRGTGLGLSIVRDIVVKAGGSIAVDTEIGRGTTFTVRLPPQ
jgi:PAS domain S-box-containing protein